MKLSFKSRLFQILFISGLSCLGALLIAGIGDLFFRDKGASALSAVSGTDQHFYEQLFYERKHNKEGEFHKKLIKFNTANIDSREALSCFLKDIYNCQPAAICLDIIHNQIEDIDTSSINKLTDAIYTIKDKLIAPCYYSNECGWIYPYYHDIPSIRDSVIFASVILDDFFQKYSFRDTLDTIVTDKFAYAAIQKTGILECPDILESKTEYINFRSKDGITINEYDNIYDYADLIKGSIVLVGNFSGPLDIHLSPFSISGRKQIYGSDIHAYTISCLLSDIDENLSGMNARKQKSYHKIGEVGNLLLTLLLSLLYSVLFIHLSETESIRMAEYTTLKQTLPIILSKGLMFYIFEILIFSACMLLTEYMMLIPNLLLLMASIFFVDILNKIYLVKFKRHE